VALSRGFRRVGTPTTLPCGVRTFLEGPVVSPTSPRLLGRHPSILGAVVLSVDGAGPSAQPGRRAWPTTGTTALRGRPPARSPVYVAFPLRVPTTWRFPQGRAGSSMLVGPAGTGRRARWFTPPSVPGSRAALPLRRPPAPAHRPPAARRATGRPAHRRGERAAHRGRRCRARARSARRADAP
jgi:hypothetical protein